MSTPKKSATTVKVAPVIESVGQKPNPDNRKLLDAHKEVTTTHTYPRLFGFGVTVLKVKGNRWTIKCGSYGLAGYDGEPNDIVKLFVTHVKREIEHAAACVDNEMNETNEPIPY